MNFLSISSPSLIGIDIQPQQIRLVQCKKIRHGFLLEHVSSRDLPVNIIKEGKITDWDMLGAVLSELIESSQVSGNVCLSLPAHLARMQSIQLPAGLNDVDIEAEIILQIRRDLPGMTDDLSIDFVTSPRANRGHMDVFFVAARKEHIWKYRQCVNATGLHVKIVDIDMYALKRALCFSLPPENFNAEANAILHVTDCHAILLIFNPQGIIIHQQWERSVNMEPAAQMQQWMQLAIGQVLKINLHKLTCCADHKYLELMAANKETYLTQISLLELCSSNPFTKMKYAAHFKQKDIPIAPSNFLIACGLAMREINQ